MRQIPVGQGGLMLGSIDVTNRPTPFTFCFDCGSVNSEHFASGLEAVEANRLDILFISHLDADHVNGIDKLTAKLTVDTVVLPCLDALQATVVACQALDQGSYSWTLASLLRDPEGWFGQRGVKRIVFVKRDGGDTDEQAEPFDPGPDRRRPEGVLKVRSPSDQTYEIRSKRSTKRTARKGAVVVESCVLDPATEIEVMSGVNNAESGLPLSWLLLPYVHPFAAMTLEAFRDAVRKVMQIPGGTDLASASFRARLLKALVDPVSRETLKCCYAVLSKDNNKPSLSLYSGPYPDRHLEWTTYFAASDRTVRGRTPAGWLSTGDANLRKRETRDPWLRRLDKLLLRVRVFVLPHHGSDASIHPLVTGRLDNALMVACAAAGRQHHPHPALVSRLRMVGQAIIQVSEQQTSEVSLSVGALTS